MPRVVYLRCLILKFSFTFCLNTVGVVQSFSRVFVFQMPGVDQMQGYNMRYGPSPIMELPLAVNPTGSARSEPLLKTHFRSAR